MRNAKTRSLVMRTKTAFIAAGAFLLLGASANAQGYNYPDNTYRVGDETVNVTVPRYHPERGPLGAPYRYVSMSKGVYVGDLNLRTRHGVREMRHRISYTARSMCRRLDVMYPITAPDSPGCYTTAMNDAMYQANIAITRARGTY
jgi:UrcA family protein